MQTLFSQTYHTSHFFPDPQWFPFILLSLLLLLLLLLLLPPQTTSTTLPFCARYQLLLLLLLLLLFGFCFGNSFVCDVAFAKLNFYRLVCTRLHIYTCRCSTLSIAHWLVSRATQAIDTQTDNSRCAHTLTHSLAHSHSPKHTPIRMSSGIDTEKFIEDIYNKPIIWNRNCGSNKMLTESTWEDLSKKFGASSKNNIFIFTHMRTCTCTCTCAHIALTLVITVTCIET